MLYNNCYKVWGKDHMQKGGTCNPVGGSMYDHPMISFERALLRLLGPDVKPISLERWHLWKTVRRAIGK